MRGGGAGCRAHLQMNGGKNGAVCGIKGLQKEVYRCAERTAPHCLIKQKVALFKSNFAQELGGLSKQAPRARVSRRKEQLVLGATVKRMLSSLKSWGAPSLLLWPPFKLRSHDRHKGRREGEEETGWDGGESLGQEGRLFTRCLCRNVCMAGKKWKFWALSSRLEKLNCKTK